MKKIVNGDKKANNIQIYLIKRTLYLNFSEVQRAVEFYFGCHFQYLDSPGDSSSLSLNQLREGAKLIKASLKAQDILILSDKISIELKAIQDLPLSTKEELGIFFRTTHEKLLLIEKHIPFKYNRGFWKLNLVESLVLLILTALAVFKILQ